MEDYELAYAAGLIDGEGTITMSREHKDAPFRIPIVSVSSTTRELLEFLRDMFGGSISRHKTYQPHHLQSWSWKISYDGALNLLRVVTPYMLEPEKLRRAQLLLQRYKNLTPRNGRYTDELRQQRLALEDEFFHPSTT